MKFIFLLILFISFTSQAQQGVIPNGNDLNSSTGSVSYSIGQSSYEYIEGSNGTLNQGLQQPYEIFTVGIDFAPTIQLNVFIAPNPVVDVLVLSFNQPVEDSQYILYNGLGEALVSSEITEMQTQIDMRKEPPAIYFLEVRVQSKKLKEFKIIKN